MSEQDLLQDVRPYLAMLHKRRGLIVTCVLVALTLAFLYNYTTRPVYQARVRILIDRDTPNVLPTEELLKQEAGSDYYQTQYELLRGRGLAERVVEKLDLHKSAEFLTGTLMSPWERFQRRFLRRAPEPLLDKNGMPLSPAVASFQSRLSVTPVHGSRLVDLHFRAYEPHLAAEAANTLAQLYMEQSLEFRYTTSTEATGWLGERIEEQRQKLQIAERALQDYREREGLLNFEERQSIVDQKVATLAAALMNARTERIAKETLYNQLQTLPASQLASFPQVVSNALIQSLRARLAELEEEQRRLSETLGPKHPDMQQLQGRARATQDQIQSEIQNVIRAVDGEYQAARQQEASFATALETAKEEALLFNRKGFQHTVLKREVDANRQLLDELLNRSKETGLESELKSTNIRIVERAETPRAPVSPQKAHNYQIALVVGLLLGVGLTVLFEHLDNTIRTPEDVKNLGLPFLGMVPDVGAKSAASRVPRPSPLILKNPQSAVAEAYRVLRTNLIFSSADSTGRALLVTSASPGEGKTTTVANVASSLALNGARVLAIDADLRRPTMHQHFGISKTPGLTDLIVGKCQASQAIQATRFKGLQVLPCGYVPPNPAELLGAQSLKTIFEALRAHYDWVLVDTPPVLGMADTPILCPMADGVMLVIGAEVSTRPAIQRAVDQIAAVGGHITGAVLNKVDLERNSYYYSQYYGEYYRSYYAEGAGKATSSRGPRPIGRA